MERLKRVGPSGRHRLFLADMNIKADTVSAANEIIDTRYVYGGGHGSFASTGYDCSGAVSFALHGGDLLASPEDSTGLESFGAAGPGAWVSVYADAAHTFLVVAGRAFDTADFGGPNIPSGSGPRWRSSPPRRRWIGPRAKAAGSRWRKFSGFSGNWTFTVPRSGKPAGSSTASWSARAMASSNLPSHWTPRKPGYRRPAPTSCIFFRRATRISAVPRSSSTAG